MLLPYRPEYSWGAGIEAPLPFNAELHAALSGQGKRFTNRTQTDYLDEYWIMDMTLSRRVSGTVTASLCVSNLMDEGYFTGDGYPGRGRSMGLILQYDGE
jgi:outer membrane cobalamin receptor